MTDIKSKRFTLLEKEKYVVDLEYNEDFAIIHLPYIEKFTREVYYDMAETIDRIEGFLLFQGYKSLWVGTEHPLMKKLAGRLGFEYRGEAEGLDVFERIK